MTSESTFTAGSCNPAPYGRACAGCSRAKTKCFYRSEGSGCERCQRLAKVCHPASSVRKRKARSQHSQPHNRLEEKLDDLVSLLRSQGVEKQTQASVQTPPSGPHISNAPSTMGASIPREDIISSAPTYDPDIVIDTSSSVVHLYPASSKVSRSQIFNDVSVHQILDAIAEEQLDTFRRFFIPMFPFFHLPVDLSAADLRQQKPFLWLLVMCLTTKRVSEQFALEETIWQIISKRIIVEHVATLDLLLGVVCFASWSHYFKKERPFMTMLSQLAVTLALELGLHNDAPKNMPRQSKSGRVLAQQNPGPQYRTLEERRSILAVFHLTSSTWTAYRKTEPLRWTSYMEDCLRILEERKESDMDFLLITQVKCHIIGNLLSCPSAQEAEGSQNSKGLSEILAASLLQQLTDIQQLLPSHLQSHRIARFYLHSTRLRVQDCALNGSRIQDETRTLQFRRLQDLDSTLTTVEAWLAVYSEVPLGHWIGINVDNFAQFTHMLVVLFKLTTLEEPGWDLEEVKRRANLFDLLDEACNMLHGLPKELGIIDADGPRRGLFFKTTDLLKTIKALFLAEMPSNMLLNTQSHGNTSDSSSADDFGGDGSVSDDFLFDLSNEPWLSDIFEYSYAFGPEGSYIPPIS